MGTKVKYVTKISPIEFTFPSGWKVNNEEHLFDLQCISRFDDMTTGVFVFTNEDLAEGSKPHDILSSQIKDLESKRTNFVVLEEKTIHEDDTRSVTTVTYSGDKGSLKSIYCFSLIQFADDPSVFAVVLQTAVPSVYRERKGLLAEVVRSARLISAPTKRQQAGASDGDNTPN
jgi:hypothetical protein